VKIKANIKAKNSRGDHYSHIKIFGKLRKQKQKLSPLSLSISKKLILSLGAVHDLLFIHPPLEINTSSFKCGLDQDSRAKSFKDQEFQSKIKQDQNSDFKRNHQYSNSHNFFISSPN